MFEPCETGTLKRAASSSPPPDEDDAERYFKRLRTAVHDLWPEKEHRSQDKQVRRILGSDPLSKDDKWQMVTILSTVVAVGKERDPDLVTDDTRGFLPSVTTDDNLRRLLAACHASGSYCRVRSLQFYRKPHVGPDFRQHWDPTESAQEIATEKSWGIGFLGDNASALWDHITKHFRGRDADGREYAHHVAIVQSSGMGKTRTVDELSKTRFVIPMNLTSNKGTGYPPPDKDVLQFFTCPGGQENINPRICCFLEALFENTSEVLQEEFEGLAYDDVAPQFRERMTEMQEFYKPNRFRARFYSAVVESAKRKVETLKSLKRDSPVLDRVTLLQALTQLVHILLGESNGSPLEEQPSTPKDGPLVILAFDGAHMLTPNLAYTPLHEPWSTLSELQDVLRDLNHLSCFSIFVSLTETISSVKSGMSSERSRSALAEESRSKLAQIQPFSNLGFDVLAVKVSLDGSWDLEKVTELSHMAHLGRPLFGTRYDCGNEMVRRCLLDYAGLKLLMANVSGLKEFSLDQKFACLAQRIPLEFSSATNVNQSAQQKKQVHEHMRVCLEVDSAFEQMETVSASEPLLSEAAYGIMSPSPYQPPFNAPEALQWILRGFSVNQGTRGELLTMLLLTLARDKAVAASGSTIISLTSFLCGSLFTVDDTLSQLSADFPHAKMYFNHFIKTRQTAVVKADRLLLLATRGAAVHLANSNLVDGINPFLCNDTTFARKNLGLILWRADNNPIFTGTPQRALFGLMDPYLIGVLDEEEKADSAVPLIKIVFALGAEVPSLSVTRKPPSSEYNAVVYEIWCAGLSPLCLPVVESGLWTWNELLRMSYYPRRTSSYLGRDVHGELGRVMNPGVASDDGYWKAWVCSGVPSD